jgi:hypothetical protein
MRNSLNARPRRPVRLECRLRRTAPLRARDRVLQVVAWQFAIGWRGWPAATAGLVLPLAVVERRGTREQWRLVPDATLWLTLTSLAAAVWLAFGSSRDSQRRTR